MKTYAGLANLSKGQESFGSYFQQGCRDFADIVGATVGTDMTNLGDSNAITQAIASGGASIVFRGIAKGIDMLAGNGGDFYKGVHLNLSMSDVNVEIQLHTENS